MLLDPRHYSERLGVIDGAQLQAVADRFDLGRVTAAEPAADGLFGQIVLLTTTRGEYAMRGSPHGHGHLTKERHVAGLIHQRSTLPGPWPYQICADTELFGWSYAVMPRLPGSNGFELWNAAEGSHRIAVAAACGDAVGQLHQVTSPFFGSYDEEADAFTPLDDYPGWVLQRLDHWRDACRAIDALPPTPSASSTS